MIGDTLGTDVYGAYVAGFDSVDAPRGYVLIAHEGAVLGLANNLGNRANNLYPKPLRILSTHTPEVKPVVL